MCGSSDLSVKVGMIQSDVNTIGIGYQDYGVTLFGEFITYGSDVPGTQVLLSLDP